ncbi:hypothetical protein [Chryseobacterium indoltheticum]|uniref:Uncharacterized protein n=1 Tax=Chryseobacterium indoltheticum TaxID=254 RepID=A0A381FHE1_9FLAO|nr:hypothetical protein [Chryseobacterium indoltheticum]AZA74754.1 hypothetical protein EG358_13710 [Chryseobacterium indoltheticum]SIQ36485.1 hypothetical protein SAMN05421682_104228 [Chryseobacterium indoltheticum]SUX45960.1 Uncharacterised protein [Chryseobacterium indoltheticum]
MNQDELLLIRDFTSTDEKREIAGKHNYQKDTVMAIIRNDRRITADNEIMMQELLEKAKENKNKKQLQK